MLLVSQSLIGSYIVASERVCGCVCREVRARGREGGRGRRRGEGSSFVEKLRASAAGRLSRASFLMINCYFDPARLSPPCCLLPIADRGAAVDLVRTGGLGCSLSSI